MCVLFVAYQQHDQFPLVIAANRDEAYARPALQAHYWEDEPQILAGRDVKLKGTWLGINQSGKFAALTNVRGQEVPVKEWKSRGWIVSDYLKSDLTAKQQILTLQRSKEDYPGYNVILADRHSLWYYSNIEDKPLQLPPGLYGISNHHLNTPWPKVVRGKSMLKESLSPSVSRAALEEQLWELLASEYRAPDHELPDTGVGLEWERILSPIFIQSEQYGTRCSTIITVDSQNHMIFAERTYQPKVKQTEVRYSLSI